MTFTRATVLLADDEYVFGVTTAELLRRAGFNCDLVADTEAAWLQLTQKTYDVLVADIMMPGNAGLDLLKRIKTLESPPAVILVTGYPSVESAVNSLEQGVFAYKVKPFDMDDFCATVQEAARRVRLLRGMQHEVGRSQALTRRLEDLVSLLNVGASTDQLNITAHQYIRTVLATVVESMMEALNVLALVEEPEAVTPLRKLSRHPDAEVYREAIRQSIDVLESTKSAFKSRELADLRRKLDLLLQVVGND